MTLKVSTYFWRSPIIIQEIFEALQERFQTVNNGTGISFTIPLTSVIGKLSYGFLSNERRVVKGDE